MRFYSPAPIFDIEEILAQAMADPKKYHAQSNYEKKNHALENCPAPVKKHNVANVQRFSEISLRLHCE